MSSTASAPPPPSAAAPASAPPPPPRTGNASYAPFRPAAGATFTRDAAADAARERYVYEDDQGKFNAYTAAYDPRADGGGAAEDARAGFSAGYYSVADAGLGAARFVAGTTSTAHMRVNDFPLPWRKIDDAEEAAAEARAFGASEFCGGASAYESTGNGGGGAPPPPPPPSFSAEEGLYGQARRGGGGGADTAAARAAATEARASGGGGVFENDAAEAAARAAANAARRAFAAAAGEEEWRGRAAATAASADEARSEAARKVRTRRGGSLHAGWTLK
jgi:hypothetical protein